MDVVFVVFSRGGRVYFIKRFFNGFVVFVSILVLGRFGWLNLGVWCV